VADTIVMQVGGAGRAAAQGARLALDPWSAGCRRGQSQDECANAAGAREPILPRRPGLDEWRWGPQHLGKAVHQPRGTADGVRTLAQL